MIFLHVERLAMRLCGRVIPEEIQFGDLIPPPLICVSFLFFPLFPPQASLSFFFGPLSSPDARLFLVASLFLEPVASPNLSI
jgi:hypothetical protein